MSSARLPLTTNSPKAPLPSAWTTRSGVRSRSKRWSFSINYESFYKLGSRRPAVCELWLSPTENRCCGPRSVRLCCWPAMWLIRVPLCVILKNAEAIAIGAMLDISWRAYLAELPYKNYDLSSMPMIFQFSIAIITNDYSSVADVNTRGIKCESGKTSAEMPIQWQSERINWLH